MRGTHIAEWMLTAGYKNRNGTGTIQKIVFKIYHCKRLSSKTNLWVKVSTTVKKNPSQPGNLLLQIYRFVL